MIFNKKLIYTFLTSLVCLILSLVIFQMTTPLALQKILTLRPSDGDLNLYQIDFNPIEQANLFSFVSSLPYKVKATHSWFIDPQSKYEDTILAGNGNCSNLAFGAMYAFNGQMHQAAIVHLLRKDYGFLYGAGHTVLSVNLEGQNILLDVLGGGIPLKNQNYIDVQRYTYNKEDIFTHQILNDRKNEKNVYLPKEYLQEVELGLVPQQEIMNYFTFVEKIYVPFGQLYFEKVFYDTLSLMFGYYPNTYVNEDFFWETYKNAWLFVFFSFVFLASFHLSYIMFILMLIQGIWSFKKR